jgi:hypothetical protein
MASPCDTHPPHFHAGSLPGLQLIPSNAQKQRRQGELSGCGLSKIETELGLELGGTELS